MLCAAKTIAVLAAYLAIVGANRNPFPRDRPLRYSYYGDIKAGLIEPAAYASQYTISGNFYVKPLVSTPQKQNEFIVALVDIKTGLYNGHAAHYERTSTKLPLPDDAKVLEKPFLLAYNDDGQLAGVKISTDEPGWSKNMKLAIANSFQVDLPSINLDLPMKPQSFMSKENTIHGECWLSYNVNPRDSYSTNNTEVNNDFTIIKFGSPRNCTGYNVFSFNHIDDEGCDLSPEKPVNMASRKVYQAERSGDDILIKLLVAHGGVNYFPWQGRSEAHYVLNNATFVLEEDQSPEIMLPNVNFQELPLITDISYQKPETNYAPKAAVDMTHGRHQADQQNLINDVRNLLMEGANYLRENNIDSVEPNYREGHVINRILDAMNFMEVSSFVQILNYIEEKSDDPQYEIIKNLFMGIVPHVGTHASSLFIKFVIVEGQINPLVAIELLAKFPLNVRHPNEKLLTDLAFVPALDLHGPNKNLDDMAVISVRKSAMLSFASLVFRTFKNTPKPEENEALNKYIDHFYKLVIKSKFDMSVVALMALRNIQVGNVFAVLTPLIKGNVQADESTDSEAIYLRLLAMWAVEKSIPNYQAAHDVFWPIMADYDQPLKLRIAAYDILIRQKPTMTNILHLYWFMVYEKSEHLYNYHHTTIKGLANSVDPCDSSLRELTTKIMRFTKIHSPVSYQLSGSYMIDAVDKVYGHGEKFSMSYTLSEQTGNIDVLNIEHSAMEGRRRVVLWKVQLITSGLSSLLTNLVAQAITPISNIDVLKVLSEAAREITKEDPAINIVFSLKNRVVYAGVFPNIQAIGELFNKMTMLLPTFARKVTGQFIFYDYLYEQQLISEMGLPIVLVNKVPSVFSYLFQREKPSNADIDLRLWRHGIYSMSIYNPLHDVWHSVSKLTATDVQLPLRLSLSILNANGNMLEITLPILPVDRFSIKGWKTHVKDITTVTANKGNSLRRSCSACWHLESVTKGPEYKAIRHLYSLDSKDTGMRYSGGIFDCENDLSIQLLRKDFFRALYKNPQNVWGYKILNLILAQRQQFKNLIISPKMGSCGIFSKIMPSVNYPTSRLELAFKFNAENTDDTLGTLYMYPGYKINARVTIKAISANTSETARLWNMHLNIDANQQRTLNTMNLRLTRETPGEKNLQICLIGQKTYPAIPDDPLKVGITKEETYGKLTFTMAETNNDECVRDQTLIIIGVKGEISEDQKRIFGTEQYTSACKKDIGNHLYSTKAQYIPRTTNCFDFAMKYTTLRKYTLDIAYDKVPRSISQLVNIDEDAIKAIILPHLNYTKNFAEEGTAKIVASFPMQLNQVNMAVATPGESFDILGAEMSRDGSFGLIEDAPMLEGFGPDPNKHLWTSPLDNTRFTNEFVNKYTHGKKKLCSIYSQVVWTFDDGQIPYNISEEWTLASGDVIDQSYAIFVKSVKGVVGLQIYAWNDHVEFSPGTEEYTLKINDEETSITRLHNGTYVPEDRSQFWSIKMAKYGTTNWIELRNLPVKIIHSLNSVSVLLENSLQGKIAGLCGHIDGTYKNAIPNEYRLTDA